MKANNGYGGTPIGLSREPIERPTIPRGILQIPTQGIVEFHADETITAVVPAPDNAPFMLTYHRVRTTAGDAEYVAAEVGPDTIVTWALVG